MFPMQVLVTGGAGYIGSIAVALLLQKGFQVTVLDDYSSGHPENIPPDIRVIKGSILNRDDVINALESCTAVMHFAGKSLVEESVEKAQLYQRINVDGANNLLLQMRDKNIKQLVFSSSASIYGEVQVIPISENSETNPTNPYGSTKLQVEELVSKECVNYGLSAVSLRYFNVTGALKTKDKWLFEQHDPETHLVPNALRSTPDTPVKVFGTNWPTNDGTCIRDYVHVVDLVEAHILALDSLGKPGHKIYNLGSGTGYSVREIIQAVKVATGKAIPFVDAEKRSGDPVALVADIAKVKNELGWEPRLGINEMVEDAYSAFKSRSPI